MAVDMFLKLDGIKGESKADGHKDEIDIHSFSWGMTQQGTFGGGGGGGAGKVNINDCNFTKNVDTATCALMLHCCDGTHIKGGLISFRKAGGKQQEYLKIKLTDILVSGYQQAGSSGDVVHDQLSLNFSKVEVEYNVQKEDGSTSKGGNMGWDIKAIKKL
jgi:type VI secretion system secreted protein Hcp